MKHVNSVDYSSRSKAGRKGLSQFKITQRHQTVRFKKRAYLLAPEHTTFHSDDVTASIAKSLNMQLSYIHVPSSQHVYFNGWVGIMSASKLS